MITELQQLNHKLALCSDILYADKNYSTSNLISISTLHPTKKEQ